VLKVKSRAMKQTGMERKGLLEVLACANARVLDALLRVRMQCEMELRFGKA